MLEEKNVLLFMIGMVIGGASSLIGAIVSYRVYLARDKTSSSGPLILTAGISGVLMIIGIIVIVGSFLVGALFEATIIGAGVFAGYVVVYVMLLYLYIRRSR